LCEDERHHTHDAARSTKDTGGEVARELGLDDARVAVRAGDTAPDDADAAAVDLPLGLVDVGDALGRAERLASRSGNEDEDRDENENKEGDEDEDEDEEDWEEGKGEKRTRRRQKSEWVETPFTER
jgi:hypothetical protein